MTSTTTQPRSSALAPDPSTAERTAPLTALQEGMLFHGLSAATPGVDVEQVTFAVDEEIDVDRFAQSWMAVIAAFPSLRSGVANQGGRPVRAVYPPSPAALPIEIRDFSASPPDSTEQQLEEILSEDRARGFDVQGYPLQRLTLVRRAADSWWGLWSFHHLILDGRSFPIVLRAVLDHYTGGPPPVERGDFTAAVEQVTQIDFQHHGPFWKDVLHGLDPAAPLTLSVDSADDQQITAGHPDQPPHSDQLHLPDTDGHPGRGDHHQSGHAPPLVLGVASGTLDTAATQKLRLLAESSGGEFTLNNLSQAAWALLLHRYQGNPAVVFGSTRACRHVCPEAAEAVGLLINTVPFRVDVNRHQTVRSLLAAVADRHRSLRPVETTPLALVQQWAGVSSGTELFETLLMFDEASLTSRMADVNPNWSFEYFGQTNYPFTMLVYGDAELSARFEYDQRRVSAPAAERLVAQYLTILQSLADSLDQPVGAVVYLTDHDQALLSQYNDTDTPYETGVTLVDLLDRQAQRTPAAPAVTYEGTTLSYAQFRQRANQLANHLAGRGVGPGSVVGVYAKRSAEMLLAIHAVVRAGGAYLPLDPDLPGSRLAMMVEDAEAKHVLVAGDVDPTVTEQLGLPAIPVTPELFSRHLTDLPATTPENGLRPHDPAYVIFTSGSTGRPKGVVNEHGGIVNRLQWMQEALALTSDDVVLQKTPFSFDVSVWELFWPLLVGAHLAIARPDDHRDPSRLASQIEKHRVTTIHFVPSMLAAFGDQVGRPASASLQRIICSGEALTKDLQDRVFALRPDVGLHNLYGPTEAAVDVTWWHCDPASPLPIVPIGYAIANTRMHVLDQELQPVPPGAIGELFIEGVQVARGYVARPDLTAERFLAPETVPGARERLYRTGDLGRHRPDGALEYLGRTDHQVKIRGLRIELGEIEAALMTHPQVSNAAVIVGSEGPTTGQLVAYVLADATGTVAAEPDDESLRAHLSVTLPEYMVPTFFVPLVELPLTTSGKIDRKRLPAPSFEVDLTVDPPTGEVETAIAAIWAALIGHQSFGRTTPFFDAGGHSLLLIRLAVELTDRFGRPVEVSDLVNAATIAAQATLVSGPGPDAQQESMADKVADKAKQRADARKRRARKRR